MIDIFCDVIDNYGDAGVCLRLCRDFAARKIQARLYCNNVEIIKQIQSETDKKNLFFKVISWSDIFEDYVPSELVIQAFSVRPPKKAALKISRYKPFCINLEYLTAEKFAEDCHTLPSFSDGYKSYFFFPGFTDKTGGIVIEDRMRNLLKQKKKPDFQISVFSYENKNIEVFIRRIESMNVRFKVLIFEGKTLSNFNLVFNTHLNQSDQNELALSVNIKIQVLPMQNQEDYDRILISSYINLVRGEDSIVRAMLAGRPFLWNIYPQDNNQHLLKLNALFNLMLEILPQNYHDTIENVRKLNLSYNQVDCSLKDFSIENFYPDWINLTEKWSSYLLSHKSLTENILEFYKYNKE